MADFIIMLYDTIGEKESTAKAVVQTIQKLDGRQTLVVAINSPGGDFFEGEAIYNAIRRYRGRKVVRIDGLAASAASYVAMAGDEIVMAPGAQIMIHRASITGRIHANSDRLREIMDYLESINRTMNRVFAQRSGQDEARIRDMLAAETWFTAEQALQIGLADRIDGEMEVAALYEPLDRFEYRHIPVAVAAMVRPASEKPDPTQIAAEAEKKAAVAAKAARPQAEIEAERARRARMKARIRMRTYAAKKVG